MNRLICLILSPILLIVMGGCSEYVDGYHFAPNPAVAQILPTPTTQPTQPPPPAVVAMSSVIGVHREDHKEGIPTSVQVRLRIENNGPESIAFNTQSLELLGGALQKFLPPLVGDRQHFDLPPAQSLDVDAFFPFPPGHSYDNTDLRSLTLRWLVEINGQSVQQVVEFRRVFRPYYYYDPYWDYPPYYGPFYGRFGGAVVVHVR